MNLQSILDRISKEIMPLTRQGKVATYIPALARVLPEQFGMAVLTVDGQEFVAGSYQTPFSIQSISKLITLTLYINQYGLELGERVGVEPSGNAFNSLVQLEYEHGKPRNPFINAGALVITDGLLEIYEQLPEKILASAREWSHNPQIHYNEEVAASEKEYGYRNAALANFLKSYHNLIHPVETVLETYFRQCSIEMSCMDLARTFCFLANQGMDSEGKRITGDRETKRINALMMTCGTYDAVGEFAFRVGIPAKSGVGGGIVAVIPGQMSLAVWSPGLSPQGNSLAGTRALELFTTYTRRSVF